jgi:hypothetical protein
MHAQPRDVATLDRPKRWATDPNELLDELSLPVFERPAWFMEQSSPRTDNPSFEQSCRQRW